MTFSIFNALVEPLVKAAAAAAVEAVTARPDREASQGDPTTSSADVGSTQASGAVQDSGPRSPGADSPPDDEEPATGAEDSSGTPFDAWLPLRRYKLTIRHKLLAQLGRVSHFIICWLSHHEGTLEDIARVTSIGAAQLEPVVRRLEGLRILKRDFTLTPVGQRYAVMVEALHERSVEFWLDSSHDASPVLVSAKSERIEPIPDGAVRFGMRPDVARSRVRERDDDAPRQLARLRRAEAQCAWLRWLFPAFEALSNDEPGWFREWDMELWLPDVSARGAGICLELTTNDATECERPALELANPVMELATRYAIPAGMPASIAPKVPAPTMLYFDYLDEIVTAVKPPEGNESHYVLEMTGDEKALADTNATLALFGSSRNVPAGNTSSDMLDRTHVLSQSLRKRAFSWSTVHDALANTGEDVWHPEKS